MLLCVVASTGFTAGIVQYSRAHGRLILYPMYDDCGYFESGMQWARNVYDRSARGLVHAYRLDPPHAPYSTMLAAVAFLVAGAEDWAPYAASGWIVLATLLVTVRLSRGLPLAERLLAAVVALGCPLLGIAVHEFRPDAAFGLCAWGAYLYTILAARPGARRSGALVSGALFGLALLTKPVAFPLVVALFMLGITLAPWISERPGASERMKRWASFAAQSSVALLVVAAPHWCLAGRRIIAYVYDNYAGQMRSVWTRHETWVQDVTYYLTGPGNLLGPQIYPLAIAVLIGGAVTWRWGTLRQRRGACALGLGLLVAYLVPTLGRANNVFFAQAFQYGLLFCALLSLRAVALVAVRRLQWRHASLAAHGALALAAAWLFQGPALHGDRNADWIVNRREIVAGIYDLISARAGNEHRTVFLTTIGDANPSTLHYFALRDGRPINFFSSDTEDRPAAVLETCSQADFVVASESGNKLQADFLPSYRAQDEVLRQLRASPAFEQIGYFEYRPAGRGFYVFQRVTPTQRPADQRRERLAGDS
jgi:hypothetical protein